ncbi:MAG: hypothetical protein HQM00_13705, partial [Magnetococcales bacterium]|nr:hypothetical protein [Magnetococcales bacterium]
DFPGILANVANKTLRTAYEAAPRTFQPFCRQVTANDFKAMNRVQLGEAPALNKVNEGGEYKRGPLGEGKESYRVETYGKIISISRQVLVNDDLNAFTRIPQLFGVAAANLESDVVWGIINSNPNMGDGVALFHANHKNLAAAGTVIVSTDGPLQVMTGIARWYPPQAVAFGSMEAWVGTAPVGGQVQFTLRKNGISTATGSIAAGSQRMVATPITLALTPLDWLTMDVTQVGSSVAGSDLTVRLTA